jgi:hypothetical protein
MKAILWSKMTAINGECIGMDLLLLTTTTTTTTT